MYVKTQRHRRGLSGHLKRRNGIELEVLSVPVLLVTVGVPGFGRFGSWQAGILVMGSVWGRLFQGRTYSFLMVWSECEEQGGSHSM